MIQKKFEKSWNGGVVLVARTVVRKGNRTRISAPVRIEAPSRKIANAMLAMKLAGIDG